MFLPFVQGGIALRFFAPFVNMLCLRHLASTALIIHMFCANSLSVVQDAADILMQWCLERSYPMHSEVSVIQYVAETMA